MRPITDKNNLVCVGLLVNITPKVKYLETQGRLPKYPAAWRRIDTCLESSLASLSPRTSQSHMPQKMPVPLGAYPATFLQHFSSARNPHPPYDHGEQNRTKEKADQTTSLGPNSKTQYLLRRSTEWFQMARPICFSFFRQKKRYIDKTVAVSAKPN